MQKGSAVRLSERVVTELWHAHETSCHYCLATTALNCSAGTAGKDRDCQSVLGEEVQASTSTAHAYASCNDFVAADC